MSIRLTKAYSNDSGSSGKPSHSQQSCWFPRWNLLPRKHGSLLVPHSQTLCKERGLLHQKQKRMCTSLNLASDIPSYIRAQNLRKDSSDSEPFGFRTDPNSSFEASSQSSRKRNRSSMLVLARVDSDMQSQSDMKSSEDDPSKAIVVSTHFLDNNLKMPDNGSSKYEKYSAILVHERKSFSAVLSRDVGDAPLFSQTETRSFWITKGVGVDTSKPTCHGGVKIRPLWSSTDSEKDNHDGDALTFIGDRSCQPSTAETDKIVDVAAHSNKNDSFGVLSPSLVEVSKHAIKDETLHTASIDLKEDKGRGKLPNTSSMDGMEPSSSRTQSLDAEHLLSCTEQPSEWKSTARKIEPEPSSRWVKRLKPSSSESSSHNKTHVLPKELSPDPDQSIMGPTKNDRHASIKTSKDAVFQSCWIQRWCQDHKVAKHGRLCKRAAVICEPNSSKLPFEELEKKQFPSIAAMALMGKSMSGFRRPCKLTKRGPLVIWNTDDS
ncbi:hypothetical protein V2J09_016707 [Rumex salicifolius]